MNNKKESKWSKFILAYALKNAISHQGKAQEGSVISGLFAEGLKKEHVKEVIEEIKKIVSEINTMNLEEQEAKFSSLESEISHREERKGLPELPNAKNGVLMRFSPSASGIMHLGHILTGMPTSLYVKKYGGKFYLRIEDTDPEKVELEAYSSLPEDAKWIFGNVTEWYAQSDRMEKYYEFAEKIIKKGKAYICTCNPEEFRELIKKSKPCPCRELSIKENLKRWNKMLDKKGYKEEKAVLRFKSDLKNINPAFRDFPLARIKEAKHARQGNKYRVWPLMNLCVSLDDMEFKITHIIRGKEHADNAERQAMIFKVFNKKIPETFFLGKYKFTDLPLSKTKLKEMIKEGRFTGWNDIRIPLARNFRKRGYQPKAFEELAIQRGLSDVDKVISQSDFFELLNNFNRKILHEIAIKSDFIKTPKGKFIIIMDDASEFRIEAKIQPKTGDIYHFIGLGYCRYEQNSKFYFAHK